MVANALDYGEGTVRLSALAEGERAGLHVRDGGPGFPAGFIDEAFERFARGATGRGSGGAGLGLSIVDAIARAHGGSAHARNREQGGADVWLTLPLAAAVPSDDRTVAPASHGDPISPA